MRSSSNLLFFTTAFFLFSLPAKLSANGPPIHGDTAFVVGIEGAGILSFFQEIRMNKLLQNGEEISDPQDREMRVRMVPLMIPYEAIPNRLLVGLALPYLDKRMEMTVGNERKVFTNRGLGDTTFFSKIQFYQKDRPGGTTRMTGKLGLKVPTGKDDARDESGALLASSLQLGSGSWDVPVGVVLTHLYQRWGINTNLVYQFNTKSNDFAKGDLFRYDLSAAMRLLPIVYEEYPTPQFNLIAELNGAISAKDKSHAVADPNTGGHTLLFSPGLQFIGGRSWLLNASYQLPIAQNLNGTQLVLNRTWTVGFLIYLR